MNFMESALYKCIIIIIIIITIEYHNRKRVKLSSLCSILFWFFVCRLLVLLPNFVVVIKHDQSLMKSLILAISYNRYQAGRMKYHVSVVPNNYFFPQHCALRENVTWQSTKMWYFMTVPVNICIMLKLWRSCTVKAYK